MPVQHIINALQKDHAIFFTPGGEPVRGQGWAERYWNVIIVISESCDFMVLYRRTGTEIEPEDEKDLRIIAQAAGFHVETKDNGIAFLGPSYLGRWLPDDIWTMEEA